MNDFRHMWDFGSMEGVDFSHSNRIHPLMQRRVQRLLGILQKDDNIQKIVVFGSALEFRCSSYSDLDIYIEKADPGKALLGEPELDCELDLVMDLDKDSRLYKEIDRKGLIIYERGPQVCAI